MKKFQSINPYTQEEIETFEGISSDVIAEKVEASAATFCIWRKTPIRERAQLMMNASQVLRDNKETYGLAITQEMGKPLNQSLAEIEKCAWVCEYYAENAASFLKDEKIASDAANSYVKYQPLGPILAIMPWNFPFWQVFRFAVPALMAGNTGLLKHASNVSRCALHIEDVFLKAGFPAATFQALLMESAQVAAVIDHPKVKAVTLTGSEKAGAAVAVQAGKNIKKSVMELGGSNAFIVLDDANLDAAVDIAVQARMQNAGQSCIAAKRFILQKEIEIEFILKFKQRIEAMVVGNPLNENTDIGPMARVDLAIDLEEQMNQSVKLGAEIISGGIREEALFTPTILTKVVPGMPAFDEELFGPMAAMITAVDDDDALWLANDSDFGLGISVCTTNPKRAQFFIEGSDDGSVFINGLVKSDPRLPFGGTKRSGYGRELSWHGIREFVNAKTVHITGME